LKYGRQEQRGQADLAWIHRSLLGIVADEAPIVLVHLDVDDLDLVVVRRTA
jgi:hypothetical protein